MTAPVARAPELLAAGAALLDTGRAMADLARPLTLLAFAALLVAVWIPTSPVCLSLLLAAAASGLCGVYAGARVGLDATLFRQLAPEGDAASLDAAMVALAMLPLAKAGRPLAARIAGARRLLRIQATLLAAQACALAAASLWVETRLAAG